MSFGWDENEIGLMNLPLSYTMGLSTINTHLFLGATCVMTNASPISKKYWDLLENEKITNIVGVPFSFELLDKLKFTKYNFPFLKSICQGGGSFQKNFLIK
ncbi:AMP-binding protein [Enterococcus faecium]